MADIRLLNVTKSYGKHRVVEGFTIEIRDGECFTFLGPSGCGKTVVLRMIAGFEQPDEGEIFIGERLVSAPARRHYIPPEERRIGVVFQDYAVWPHKTVLENVIYPLTIQKVAKEEASERALKTIAMVNLGGLEHRMPFQLSGGQQQRVALARALVSRPDVMLLDEPLSNLDANLREEMRFEIKELQKNTGVTILYVTHDQEVALAISDRVAVMGTDGRICQIGTPDEIYEQPIDPFVFRFMGVSNFLPLEEREGRLFVRESAAALDHPIPAGREEAVRKGRLVAGCRPFDIKLLPPGRGTQGVVQRSSYLGPIIDYAVTVGGTELRVQQSIAEAIAGGGPLPEGSTVGLHFPDLKWFEQEGELTPAGGAA